MTLVINFLNFIKKKKQYNMLNIGKVALIHGKMHLSQMIKKLNGLHMIYLKHLSWKRHFRKKTKCAKFKII